jgi:hypothetical protein
MYHLKLISALNEQRDAIDTAIRVSGEAQQEIAPASPIAGGGSKLPVALFLTFCKLIAIGR